MNIEALLYNVQKYPHVFKIAAQIPAVPGTWGGYPYDDVMFVWIDTSHPIAITFFKDERNNRMGYELTVQEQHNISSFLRGESKEDRRCPAPGCEKGDDLFTSNTDCVSGFGGKAGGGQV